MVLIVLTMWLSSLPVVAQTQTITINQTDTPIETILKSITSQAGYKFVYSGSVIDTKQLVSVKIRSNNINVVLDAVFKETKIAYTIEGKQVALSLRKDTKATQPVSGSRIITGRVTDNDGSPLVGALVNVEGTSSAAYSGISGEYSLTVKDDPQVRLSYRYLGMAGTTVQIGSRSRIDVSLVADNVSLDQVVVTGYQTLSKERTTGSYSIVTSQQLENKLQPSLKSIIEGQTAGVVLTKDGNIEIRGVSTINGVKTPLIVVDGYPLIGDNVGMESVNPDNIENITILKDAVAASIYGARASNGVIVITTKSAKKGTFNLSYKGIYQITMKPDLSKLNLATTEDYMDAELDIYNQNPNSSYSSYNSYSRLSDYTYLLMAKNKGLISTSEADAQIEQLRQNDALKEIEKYLLKPKQSQQHSFSLSSSTETNQLNTALRYNKEYGNLMSNDNSRFIFDISNTWKPNKWISVRAFANVNYSESNATAEQYSSFTSYSSSSRVLPYTNMYDDSGNPIAWTPVGQRRIATYNTFPGMKDVTYHPETDLDKAMTISNNLQARLGGDINVKFCDFHQESPS